MPSSSGERLRALDGLRGVAAVVVLIHHSLLINPTLAAPYADLKANQSSGSWEWWITYTPLHLLWEGTAAVYVFFILSGIVLALPVLRSAGQFNWRAYFPQRLIRLYAPVWGAVALAVATFWISPRTAEMPSVWIEQRPVAVTGGEVLRDLTLVTGNGGLASPLWSLQWEILFSLLLPIYIWFALKLRGHPLIAVAGCLLLIAVGGALHAVRFLPMFAIGVVLAVALPELTSVATRFSSGKSANMRWFLLTALGALMLSSHWLVAPLNPAPIVQRGLIAVTVGGALVFVLAALFWHSAKQALESPVVQWLAKISFSLYLVHEPIVLACAFFLGPGREPLATLVSLPLAVMLSYLFYLAIERPSHRLARAVRRFLLKRAALDAEDRSVAA
ncbi:Peptidoglycan/LPS O-acetylase OafA/YrhL, contains acyltransferase and SGNH-hydrolase domains [Paramicrobacterium humi]|uniref:Peptidoglycan/LPS O-acetylase OafA/YrhL, contains acyltransferase and SGNH-hydrolase domains n=1 Tax=Paramicrobacterium humi TaxID=640635 RepID=A0A1H4NEW5_9MICO|nr:Peptidoglycan/LPS O-acetylase OafA/YrhL, contains acyltransferase and SGNH-hydrolase domains [Microbacterium humi]